ncbi:MAG: globin family protein [Burkholderiaceae bacterium]
MTPEQKQIVKDTWAQVLPIKDAAADMFYGRLFEQYPEVRPYFKSDMKGQGEKLMTMLNQAVMSLDHIEKLIAPLHQAGLAHKGYGVHASDYDKVGECFLWTLSQGLGDAYTADVAEAWTVTYQTLSSVMIEGAQYDAKAA